MIDLNETKKAQALLKEWCKQGMESISTPVKYGQLLDLMNRLASEEKDAARYRHLRFELERSQGSLALFCGDSYVCDLDAFLDEEMQHSGDGK